MRRSAGPPKRRDRFPFALRPAGSPEPGSRFHRPKARPRCALRRLRHRRRQGIGQRRHRPRYRRLRRQSNPILRDNHGAVALPARAHTLTITADGGGSKARASAFGRTNCKNSPTNWIDRRRPICRLAEQMDEVKLVPCISQGRPTRSGARRSFHRRGDRIECSINRLRLSDC